MTSPAPVLMIATTKVHQNIGAGHLPNVTPGQAFWALPSDVPGLITAGQAYNAPAGTAAPPPEPASTANNSPGAGAGTSNSSPAGSATVSTVDAGSAGGAAAGEFDGGAAGALPAGTLDGGHA